tara:strand:+ start:3269 stop:3505 length:237 start_codon:yes stop_codon:yes gene_type:complete
MRRVREKRLLICLLSYQNMSVREMVQDMINDLTDALEDAEKHDSGNSAAGTRIRKIMQTCKGLAQDVRVKVQDDKNSR